MRATLACLLAAAGSIVSPAAAQRVAPTGPAAALSHGKGPRVVGAPIVRRAGMTIDTDGWIADPVVRRRVVARDPWHQDDTNLHVGGKALDPTVVPYIVLPLGFRAAALGDLARITYAGRIFWAVCGDRGPADHFGEGSVALAELLGIDSDGTSGGVASGVTYEIFPDTARLIPSTQPGLVAFLVRMQPRADSY